MTARVLAPIIVALSAVSVGCEKSDKAAAKAEEQFPTMTPDEVEAQLATKSVTPVDCNGEGTRKKMGILPGAILITDEEQFGPSELPADKTTKLVFYCSKET